MLSVEEKAASLRRGIFEALDDGTLSAMAQRMGQNDLADGDVLFMKGEPGDEIFVIVEGQIEIFIDEQVIAVLGPGDLFGEMAVLGGGRRTAGGRAKGATTLLFLKGKAIKLLIQQIPDLAFSLFRVLIERLEEANRLSLFLAGEKTVFGEVEVVEGDLAGQRFPVYHARAMLGKSKGSVGADALRIALPTQAGALLETHAFVMIDSGVAYIEPRDGTVEINGAAIDDSMALEPNDVVRVGGLGLRFHPKG